MALSNDEIKAARSLQRGRVDAWDKQSFGVCYWPEIKMLLSKTADALAVIANLERNSKDPTKTIVGSSRLLEQDLLQLFAFHMKRTLTADTDAEIFRPSDPLSSPSEAWKEFFRKRPDNLFAQAIDRLHQYAAIGTLMDDDLPGSPEPFLNRVKSDLEILGRALGVLPKQNGNDLARNTIADLRSLQDIAAARFAIDADDCEAPIRGLAWLSNMSVKTVQNGVSRGELETTGPGQVTCASARKWMQGRDWTRSCWREAIQVLANGWAAPFGDLGEEKPDHAVPVDDEAREDWVFVPRAKDGSLFLPGTRHFRGWSIGPRGAERQFGDYWRALEHLQSVPRPFFRRSAGSGLSSPVTAQVWIRFTRDDLESRLRAVLANDKQGDDE